MIEKIKKYEIFLKNIIDKLVRREYNEFTLKGTSNFKEKTYEKT